MDRNSSLHIRIKIDSPITLMVINTSNKRILLDGSTLKIPRYNFKKKIPDTIKIAKDLLNK
jgi:hypothetical protein